MSGETDGARAHARDLLAAPATARPAVPRPRRPPPRRASITPPGSPSTG